MSAPSNWIRFFSIHLTVSLLMMLGPQNRAIGAEKAVMVPAPRKILAIYDSGEGLTGDTSKIFENCQTVLNYLGLVVDYQDVNQPLPGPRTMAGYRGILTWFESDGINNPQVFLAWLGKQLNQGIKLVIFGSMGFSEENLSPAVKQLAKAVYAHLGLDHGADFTNQRMRLGYATVDPAMVGFERAYPPVPMQYERFSPLDASVTVHLGLTRTDRPGVESAVVSTGPGGGMIWGPYVLWREAAPPYRKQWYVNPFAFFTAALDLATLPKPDPTTLNGRRIAFSHIDGDAFAGFTEVRKNAVCADIIRNRILVHYPFPVTVSVIVAEIDPAAKGNDQRVALAREIFALPNVEPASHAYSHPFYWDPDFDNTLAEYPSQYGMQIPGYEFDAAMEIDYSVRYINDHLAPPGKPCRVFLWTGNCKPLAVHIKRCDDLGLLNMNGGDTVFDAVNDSYTGVAPLYRKVNGRYQYHIGEANENILTNLWEGPFYGYREIITTMQRTGTPRRIKPIDIYYHFYSGQYKASVEALETVYQWVLSQPIAPMFTSSYLNIAKSWLGCRLFVDASGQQYGVENYGDCLTLRFDDENRVPDLIHCRNVLGFFKDQHGLFVHLAPGESSADIAFARQADLPVDHGPRPYLRQASGWVRNFQFTGDQIVFQLKGFGSGYVELAGMKPGTRWHLVGNAPVEKADRLVVDENGTLVLAGLETGVVEIGRR
jgi:polysaccharide biosynthesis protein PelA